MRWTLEQIHEQNFQFFKWIRPGTRSKKEWFVHELGFEITARSGNNDSNFSLFFTKHECTASGHLKCSALLSWGLADVQCEKICIVAVNSQQICCMFSGYLNQFKRNTIIIRVCVFGRSGELWSKVQTKCTFSTGKCDESEGVNVNTHSHNELIKISAPKLTQHGILIESRPITYPDHLPILLLWHHPARELTSHLAIQINWGI